MLKVTATVEPKTAFLFLERIDKIKYDAHSQVVNDNSPWKVLFIPDLSGGGKLKISDSKNQIFEINVINTSQLSKGIVLMNDEICLFKIELEELNVYAIEFSEKVFSYDDAISLADKIIRIIWLYEPKKD